MGNQKTPASSAANLYVTVDGSTEVGGYSSIRGNKFGAEGRTDGHCIVVTGSSGGAIRALVIENNLLHYDSSAAGKCAIKIDGIQMNGVVIRNNSLTYCDLLDSSTTTNGTVQGSNDIGGNTFVAGGQWSQLGAAISL